MIGLGMLGFIGGSCFVGGLVWLGRPLCFMLGFPAGAVCVSEIGERGRGVFPSAAMVVVAVVGLFVQRRLCVCPLLVASVCMALRKSRLRLWVLQGAVVGPFCFMRSLRVGPCSVCTWLCSPSPFRSVLAGGDGHVQTFRSLVV